MPWRELTDIKAHWRFLHVQPFSPGLFLQSPAWAKVQKHDGCKVAVLGYVEKNLLLGIAVCIKQRLPLGMEYWSVPKGPLLSPDASLDKWRAVVNELSDQLGGNKMLFLRVEPAVEVPGLKRTLDNEPRATTIVDLSRSEEDILSAMHPKTRYNIRLAERHGLRFRLADASELPKFRRLLLETARRDGFRAHADEHYASILGVQQEPEYRAYLGLVELNDEPLAASLLISCQGIVTYLHGASSRASRELMAPYLLHWGAMQSFKRQEAGRYDFWGVEPLDGSLPSWAGFTRFKLGFGGDRHESPGTFDLPASRAAYFIYRQARSLRRILGQV